MKKVLFVATVVQKHIAVFHLPFLKMFRDAGWETSVCARNDYQNPAECVIPDCDCYYDFPFERNPFKINNMKTYRKLKKLLQKEKYDIVHCHTPTGGVLARLAARAVKSPSTRVIYTAHGFHFFKGAPLLNWLVYFPIEWICSFFTDTLITINKEDYEFAKKHMHAKEIRYVPGVGLDLVPYEEGLVDKAEKRAEFGVPECATVLLSVGELNENKNHALVIEALAKMKNENVHYCIAGKGDKLQDLQCMAEEKNVSEQVHFLGYRTDVCKLLKWSDIFCFPSFREGLPVSLMEAMAAGLPCVATAIRGNTDLIQNGRNGFLVSPTDADEMKKTIEMLLEDEKLRKSMQENNCMDVKEFSIENIKAKMAEIYGF